MARKSKDQWEYGDFQTPAPLAEAALEALRRRGFNPATVLEPSCGKGAFLLAALRTFPDARRYIGVEINRQYLSGLEDHLRTLNRTVTLEEFPPPVRKVSFDDDRTLDRTVTLEDRVDRPDRGTGLRLIHGDFFNLGWLSLLSGLPEPILIVGNPPWVTNAELGLVGSDNLPSKSNFQGRRGYDAVTGKSNFDISEWMLLQHLEWLRGRRGGIAMLCKTAVARKVLFQAWTHGFPVSEAAMFLIDAQKHFGASVDACLLLISMTGEAGPTDCAVYDAPDVDRPSRILGYHDALVLSDVDAYKRWRHLRGTDKAYLWRSGIKHDCSRVMELEPEGERYRNGDGTCVGLEDVYLYPLLKSSDVGNGSIRYGRKYVLVTQRYVGEDTAPIRTTAPRTWAYLTAHREAFDRRASAIYRNRPGFSIFGVGPYTFAPWKVAISGFYKGLSFKAVAPHRGRPVVMDDTVYFLPCWSEEEALFIESLLTSRPAQEFFQSMIFWTDKRPITIDVLKRLDLRALSRELGLESKYLALARERSTINRLEAIEPTGSSQG